MIWLLANCLSRMTGAYLCPSPTQLLQVQPRAISTPHHSGSGPAPPPCCSRSSPALPLLPLWVRPHATPLGHSWSSPTLSHPQQDCVLNPINIYFQCTGESNPGLHLQLQQQQEVSSHGWNLLSSVSYSPVAGTSCLPWSPRPGDFGPPLPTAATPPATCTHLGTSTQCPQLLDSGTPCCQDLESEASGAESPLSCETSSPVWAQCTSVVGSPQLQGRPGSTCKLKVDVKHL